MPLDVAATRVIACPRAQVFAYAADPSNDPAWIGGIKTARFLTEPPVRAGTRVARVAGFLGRRIDYVLEVVEFLPGKLVDMQSVTAPFPMRVTYRFEDAPGGTRATVRVRGEAGGYYRLAGPLLGPMVRRNLAGDLRRLRQILETAEA